MASFGKINLASLPSHKVMEFGQQGSKEKIKAIVLPIDKNYMHLSEKGNVYLDLVIFERKEPLKDKDGAVEQTHFVKQSIPKKIRDAFSEEEKRAQPIIGNLNIWNGAQVETTAKPDTTLEETDASGKDLPF